MVRLTWEPISRQGTELEPPQTVLRATKPPREGDERRRACRNRLWPDNVEVGTARGTLSGTGRRLACVA